MKIKSVEFAGAVAQPGGAVPPGRLPEIAFSGRSNVGKSSLINCVLGRTRHRIAHVSARPGKTQEINFYRVRAALDASSPSAPGQRGVRRDVEFFLVDLPGYSFARVPAVVRERWKPLIESYFSSSAELRGVVQLIDARHGATADDRDMVRYLAALGVPTLFALTKIDKLTHNRRRAQLPGIVEELGVDSEQAVPFSATTGEGRDLLLDGLAELLVRPQGSVRRPEGEP